MGNQTHLTGCVTTSQTPYEQQKMPEIRFSPSFPPFTAPLKEVNWSTRRPCSMLMSSKVKIGSASRSSTDLSYFNREVKHRAQPPARGGRASAARRDRRWASRSSELRRWRQPSGSATGTGAILAAVVDGRAYTGDGGAAALRPSSAFSQASQASARKKILAAR